MRREEIAAAELGIETVAREQCAPVRSEPARRVEQLALHRFRQDRVERVGDGRPGDLLRLGHDGRLVHHRIGDDDIGPELLHHLAEWLDLLRDKIDQQSLDPLPEPPAIANACGKLRAAVHVRRRALLFRPEEKIEAGSLELLRHVMNRVKRDPVPGIAQASRRPDVRIDVAFLRDQSEKDALHDDSTP